MTERITRQRALAAALRIVDERGLEVLTFRSLATELGVYPASIQWQFGTKAELLGAVGALVFDDIELPDDEAEWTAWVTELCHGWRAAIHRHPQLAPILGGQLITPASALPLVERIVAVLEKAGFSGNDLVDAYNTIVGFVVGWTAMELSAEPVDQSWKAKYLDELDALDPAEFPALQRNMGTFRDAAFMTRSQNGSHSPMDRSFAFAVEALISGLSAALTPRRDA